MSSGGVFIDIVRKELIIHLLTEIENSWLVLSDEVGVNGGAAVSKIIRLNEAFVVFEGEIIDVVGAIGRRITWIGWIAYR